MIPILYEQTEKDFTSNGLGILAECESCEVTEEVNGVYECEFTYPITGRHYADLTQNKIIYVNHDGVNGPQPFDIYAHSKPINGLVTFNAHHVSYRLSNVAVVRMIVTDTPESAMYYLNQEGYTTTDEFSFHSEITGDRPFSVEPPRIVREVLMDEGQSILSTFGQVGVYHAEYLFDHFDVTLKPRRGSDTDITIRYGKDLLDIEDNLNSTDSYNAIVPYCDVQEEGEDEPTRIMLSNPPYVFHDDGNILKAVVIDYTDDERPWVHPTTESQLRDAAEYDLNNFTAWKPHEDITVNFIQLSNDTQYEQFKNLQKIELGDTVSVIADRLGINIQERVVKIVYDALHDRYSEITIGDLPTTANIYIH